LLTTGSVQVTKLGLKLEQHYTPAGSSVGSFVYYPDHIVRLGPPKSLAEAISLFSEPVLTGAIPAILRHTLPWTQPPSIDPHGSIGEALERVFGGRALVDNLASAMVHGIYGGDIWNLQLRGTMFEPMIDRMMGTIHNSISDNMIVEVKPEDWAMMLDIAHDNEPMLKTAAQATQVDYIWFDKGFSTLTNALADALRANPNVTIKTGEPVETIRYSSLDNKVAVCLFSFFLLLTSSPCTPLALAHPFSFALALSSSRR